MKHDASKETRKSVRVSFAFCGGKKRNKVFLSLFLTRIREAKVLKGMVQACGVCISAGREV